MDARPTAKPKPLWLQPWALLASVAAGIAAALVTSWLIPSEDGPQPVVEVRLENSRLGRLMSGHALRDLPFNLDMPERVDLAICLRLAGRVRGGGSGEPAFADDDTRKRLEDVLERRPDFFYAEYLLGLWHASNGHPAQAEKFSTLALEHAPAVLVQRYVQGRQPLAGGRIPTFQVECNRIRHGRHDSSLKLTFFDLTTDRDGYIRLPVYDTVYRLFNTADPDGYEATYAELGWFEALSRVGILPEARVRPLD